MSNLRVERAERGRWSESTTQLTGQSTQVDVAALGEIENIGHDVRGTMAAGDLFRTGLALFKRASHAAAAGVAGGPVS